MKFAFQRSFLTITGFLWKLRITCTYCVLHMLTRRKITYLEQFISLWVGLMELIPLFYLNHTTHQPSIINLLLVLGFYYCHNIIIIRLLVVWHFVPSFCHPKLKSCAKIFPLYRKPKRRFQETSVWNNEL